MKFKYLFLAMGLLVLLAACKQPETGTGDRFSPPIGKHMQMAQFKLTSLTDNTELDSSELAGQVLLVTFFATWCPPCIQEIPSFIALQEAYKTKGFSVVAFSVDEGGSEPVQNLIRKYSINYPVMLADLEVARGFGGVAGIPVSFLVNRKGEIVKKYLGYVGHDVIEEEVNKMLAAR